MTHESLLRKHLHQILLDLHSSGELPADELVESAWDKQLAIRVIVRPRREVATAPVLNELGIALVKALFLAKIPLTTAELAKKADHDADSHFRTVIKRLVDDGIVDRPKHGMYGLTRAGLLLAEHWHMSSKKGA